MTNTSLRPVLHRGLVLVSLVALALSAGVAAAAPPAPPAPPPMRAVYRFDVSITGIDDAAHPATYTLILEENQTGAISTGTNIALAPAPNGASSRVDVGLKLRLSYTLRGSVVLAESDLELSSVQPAGRGAVTLHHVRAQGVVAIASDKPALFASVYDLVSHRRYEVTISAAKLL